jgi:hypothetical protein
MNGILVWLMVERRFFEKCYDFGACKCWAEAAAAGMMRIAQRGGGIEPEETAASKGHLLASGPRSASNAQQLLLQLLNVMLA